MEDNQFEVQIAALNSLKDCAKFIPPEHIETEIIPRLNEYFLKPLNNLPTMNMGVNNINQNPININGPSEFIIKNQALAKNLMFIGTSMTQESIKRCLLPIFENLLKSNHPEVRIKLFENYSQLVNVYGNSTLMNIVKQELNKFVGDTNWRTRREGFIMIDNFAKKCSDKIFEDPEIVNKIHEGLRDKVYSVRETTSKVLVSLSNKVNQAFFTGKILPIIENYKNSKNSKHRTVYLHFVQDTGIILFINN